MAIVAISSIHLLQIFLNVDSYTDRQITWMMAIHGVFLVGIIAMAVMDRLEGYGKKERAKGAGTNAKPPAAATEPMTSRSAILGSRSAPIPPGSLACCEGAACQPRSPQ
ncbi:MAG: hypothetical protein RML45_16165 [Acetobacteraceae bacterium]|nr:hypothetical protein [Acetobacteraceae bacterium]